ncbi:UTP--glucose-1-phosphate uridylyltransferase [Jannaschia aquimarina]|uniref:UTP--glucose-1-phosphate uridylyltransferase n=1 Tax=Jannaschia aquimarina TaxID=935700 RepID=A0A0D1CRT8_9RHOB|nr:UTP--glucose-1-phosphate uridylyltransferase [Jannaschia aquimarina]KIT17522.1 UTP--glucose-1-phosphate uridylyltransferase [Jannaschia aquimarina]SNS73815.1 UDP-glucose pyrophosphorylase [Jannaschia aquimarina]
MNRLDTVIFPVAGLGTRMLPATKVMPKELLPVYDTPLLQFAVEEAIAAGARRLVMVSHPSKDAIQKFFEPDPSLEAELEEKGKTALLASVQATNARDDVEIRFVMQHEQKGLGHAVLCAADDALEGPVGVILPDDLILGTPALAEMTKSFDPDRMGSLVAAQEVPREKVSSYGIFDCDGKTPSIDGRAIAARGFVEKPAPKDAPSRLAAVGRYILSHKVFDVLRDTGYGAGGEIQLTDAIAAMGKINAFRFSGTRYDCGNKDGLVDATLAVQRARVNLRVAAE